jgi:alcohol dehydrogenase class IV
MDVDKDFNFPGLPKIFFGPGALNVLPGLIRACGDRALVITGGRSFAATGRWTILGRALHRTGLSYQAIAVQGEPTADAIDAIVHEYRAVKVDGVAAIGGGSVIDCGKAVSAMLVQEGSVRDYLEGVGTRTPSGAKIPLIAVPTTAGTGSEATRNAVVCNRKEGYKKSLRHEAYRPDIAIVDPTLTLSVPPPITASSGLDAVSQLIEAYTSTKTDPAIDRLILKALTLARDSLLPLTDDQGKNLDLREKMSYAALVSGIALDRNGLGVVHGLAGPLGGVCPVPHGVACGKLLFPTMTFVVQKVLKDENRAARRRFAEVGRILSGKPSGDDTDGCKRFLDVLFQWSQWIKLPRLSGFGLTAPDMEAVLAMADCKNSPAVLSVKEMKTILETIR